MHHKDVARPRSSIWFARVRSLSIQLRLLAMICMLFRIAASSAADDSVDDTRLVALRNGFAALDADRSGFIDRREFEPARRQLEEAFGQQRASFEGIDANHDDKISLAEVEAKPWLLDPEPGDWASTAIGAFHRHRVARGSHDPPFDSAHLPYAAGLEDPSAGLPRQRTLDARAAAAAAHHTHNARELLGGEIVRQLRSYGVAFIEDVLDATMAGAMAAALEEKMGVRRGGGERRQDGEHGEHGERPAEAERGFEIQQPAYRRHHRLRLTNESDTAVTNGLKRVADVLRAPLGRLVGKNADVVELAAISVLPGAASQMRHSDVDPDGTPDGTPVYGTADGTSDGGSPSSSPSSATSHSKSSRDLVRGAGSGSKAAMPRVPVPPAPMYSIFTYVTDVVAPGAGATMLFPGTHLLRSDRVAQISHSDGTPHLLPPLRSVVRAGTVAVYDSTLLHQGLHNNGSNTR